MFSSLSLGILYFPCSVEVCLGFKLERMFKRKNQSILWMDKSNLFLSINVLLFDVLTILILHFVILQFPQSFCVKRKKILSQTAWFFFHIFCWIDIHFKRHIIDQSDIKMNISSTQSVTVPSNLQFKLIFSVLKKLQIWIQ